MNVWLNLFCLVCEIVLIIFFFRDIPPNERKGRRFSWIILLALALVYFSSSQAQQQAGSFTLSNFIMQAARSAYHIAVVYVWLRLSKEIQRKTALYLSFIYVIIYLTAWNVRIIFNMVAGNPTSQLWLIITRAAYVLFEFVLIVIARRCLKFEDMGVISWYSFILQIIWIFLEIYFKWSVLTQSIFEEAGIQGSSYIAFSFIASLAVYAMMIMYEYNQSVRSKNRAFEVESVKFQYELQNLRREKQANDDVRRMHHDMKNHLLALKKLNENNEETTDYISRLISDIEPYESNVKTGNDTADAILAEKIRRAKIDGIQMNICLDLTAISFVDPADIVTIFGNAADNAIEASKGLSVQEERIIYLKSTPFANYILIRISNRFSGTLVQTPEGITTTKKDKKMHGIGLKSIQRSAEKYKGNTKIDIDNENGWFRLVIMIPVPAGDDA